MVAQRVRNAKQLGLNLTTSEKFKKHQRLDPDIKHLFKGSLFDRLKKSMVGFGNIEKGVDKAFYVMLIGDSGVGKTCVLIRFKDGAFLSGSFISTVGIDFRNKTINVDGKKVKLQIWDTAGQERFRSITHAYYRDAHALLLLYDVGSRKSFENTRAWLSEIREYAPNDAVIMLLGNKCDLAKERQVKREEGEKLAQDYNVPFLETSAKSGLNVDLAFEAASRELMNIEARGKEHNGKFNIGQYVSEKEQKPGCCG